MKKILFGIGSVVIIFELVFILTGCQNIPVSVIDDIIGYATNYVEEVKVEEPIVIPDLPSIDVEDPVDTSVKSCGCDLSKPLAIPLVPRHGKNDDEVNAWLRERWVNGIADNCGGIPGDIRPQLIRPAGKCFSYKWIIIEGGVKLALNGEKMTLTDGDFEGQRFHLIGVSSMEAPNNGAHPSTLPDWIPSKSGVETEKKKFPYFEVRDL